MCRQCESSNEQPRSGVYSFKCVECMARLIKSARPNKKLQAGHIAAMARFHRNEWAHVWPLVQEKLKG
jgi:hypothetical protein